MSGVLPIQQPDTPNMQELIIANSEVIQQWDFVTIDSNGFLKRTAATEKIAGYFGGPTVTAASDNQTVAMVKGKYVIPDSNAVFEMTSDQAASQTDIGAYADVVLSGTAMLCDLAAGASGQLFVVDFDPDRDGTTTKVRVTIAEPQELAFTQA